MFVSMRLIDPDYGLDDDEFVVEVDGMFDLVSIWYHDSDELESLDLEADRAQVIASKWFGKRITKDEIMLELFG